MKTTIVNKWINSCNKNKVTLYQFEFNDNFVNAEVERSTYKGRLFLRCETTFGLFECRNIEQLKKFIGLKLNEA